MLQHNSARAAGHRAHLTHAAVLALHTFCCGLPALAMIATLSGITSGAVLLPDIFGEFHHFMHAHEVWILALSAALVVSGGILEVNARKGGHNHGFPWLFAFSALCFVANVAIIVAHRA